MISYLVLKSESDTLAEHVALLDPFPEVEPFTKLCQKQSELREAIGGVSLSHEIERFLSVSQKCPQSSRKEGLKFLQGLLPSSKFQIAHLKEQGLIEAHDYVITLFTQSSTFTFSAHLCTYSSVCLLGCVCLIT